jgi:hypothetical protein
MILAPGLRRTAPWAGARPLETRGPLLGFFPGIQLADVRFRLAPGDTLLLCTDGAIEAREQLSSPEAARPLFGEDARRRRAHPPGSPCPTGVAGGSGRG